jgi:ribosomal protein S15P/S13E
MLKLPLLLFALLGTCAAQNPPALTELQGSARVLMVFAPDSNSAKLQTSAPAHRASRLRTHRAQHRRRSRLIASKGNDDFFPGENLPLATATEQADARTKFHIQPGDFVVILLSQDGAVRIRSASPVDIHALTASLDALPKH